MKQGNNEKWLQVEQFKPQPLGDSAIELRFGDSINSAVHTKIRSFARLLENNPFPGLLEWVPAYTTLTIFYDPWLVSQGGTFDPYARVLEHLQTLDSGASSAEPVEARQLEIPVCYGEVYGPDLETVAQHTGLAPEEVIRLHTTPEYLVYMIGFAPGFPYLGGLDERLRTPRKDTPRLKIPAGAVGIAGAQTGIYPLETPGGWQLIGRTPLQLFRPDAEPPSLLQAGDRIRFVSISPAAFQELQESKP